MEKPFVASEENRRISNKELRTMKGFAFPAA